MFSYGKISANRLTGLDIIVILGSPDDKGRLPVLRENLTWITVTGFF
jgi:hypothetical protein